MQLQRLSQHRLFDCSKLVGSLPSNEQFLLMESVQSNFIKNFYVVEKTWNSSFKKVIPLAHLKVSPKTGNMKLVTWQPEFWNLTNADHLKNDIFDLVAKNMLPLSLCCSIKTF
jgi:hypothetical protein